LPQVIHSLRAQTIIPTRIVLNISDKPAGLDTGVCLKDLPRQVIELMREGVIEVYNVENIGSYRKLIPTLERFSDHPFLVITADDDALYPGGWVEGLLNAYSAYSCAAAYRCRVMQFDSHGLTPYLTWPFVEMEDDRASYRFEPQLHIMPTGRGGILYHSRFFDDLPLLHELRLLSPQNDDLLFRFYLLLRQVPVVAVHYKDAYAPGREFAGVDFEQSLWSLNRKQFEGLSPHDHAINRILRFFEQRGLGQRLPGYHEISTADRS
jgi:hypothetical protein